MKYAEEFEAVIGLEVHIELKTASKMFCSCKSAFGGEPNTQICPVCMGLPGAMPTVNKKAVELAVRAGLCTNCRISEYSLMARKNYFYPDLPKAYQISQYDLPLCTDGWLDIEVDGEVKRIGIERIHMEEDAGKLLHSELEGVSDTLIDFNRCGVPLIEVVTRPDIRSADEARAFLQKLRSIMLYAGVSDCKMNEGSLRCDVNLSVRRRGDNALGVRTEMKNLNSFQFITKAIECEYERQIDVVSSGGAVVRETRRYDEKARKSFSMRSKESIADYRYFTDPDLTPIIITAEERENIRAALPMLPDRREAKYISEYGVSPSDAQTLTAEPETSDYFEASAVLSRYPKICANIILSEIMGIRDGEAVDKIEPKHLATLADLLGDGEINSATAKKLVREMWQCDFDPVMRVEKEGLRQIRDEEVIAAWARIAIEQNPKSVSDYLRGKTAAAKAVIGKTMAQSGGRADPAVLSAVVMRILDETASTVQ